MHLVSHNGIDEQHSIADEEKNGCCSELDDKTVVFPSGLLDGCSLIWLGRMLSFPISDLVKLEVSTALGQSLLG
jgi:hypothetical protein